MLKANYSVKALFRVHQISKATLSMGILIRVSRAKTLYADVKT